MNTDTAQTEAAGQNTTTPAADDQAAEVATLIGGDAAPEAQSVSQGEGAGDSQGDKPADDGGEKPGDKPAGAPEKYELTLPEGYSLDETTFTKAEPVLRELNLTNEQASKLAGVIAEVRASESEQYAQQVQEWGKTVQSDPEIGGKAFEDSVNAARLALATHGTPELKGLLNSTGLGNHPEVVRFFARIGKTIPREDKVVSGDRSGSTTRSIEERLYGKK